MTKEQRRERDRRAQEKAKPAYEALMSCYPLTLDDLGGEQWREVSDKYQVSNFGRVKSFWGKSPRILKPALHSGYLRVTLSIDDEQKSCRVHVIVAQAFIPNPDHKPEVNHLDGNKFNCYVGNLYWATSAENQQHAYDTGLKKSGLENPRGKIKDEKDIIYIRDNPDNLTLEQLAEKFGVDPTTISKIQRGKRYPKAGGTVHDIKKQRVPAGIRRQIRADWATGLYTKADLARQYGCAPSTIRNIINEV